MAAPMLLVAFGLVALGLSMAPGLLSLPGGGPGEDVAAVLPPFSEEDFAYTKASAPQRAAPTDAAPPGAVVDTPQSQPATLPPPTPRPVVRAPVPVDAQPVSRAGAVAGGSQIWIAQVAARTSAQHEVAIVALSPAVDALATGTTALLREMQLNAYQSALPDVRRPDVILLVDDSAAGSSVWYCSPSQGASASLAGILLSGLALPSDDSGGDDVSSTMPCDSLHLGRASSAAALVRVPADATGAGVDAAKQLAAAVSRYLEENADAVRRSRQALRTAWPAVGPITSHYGPSHPLGIDIGQATGAILAATDGKVIFAGGDPCCSYGRFVVITGTAGLTTVYGHLETLSVREGDTVRIGQSLGEVGCTGHCSGNHLHFEVIKDGVRQNPMDYLP